MAGSKRSLQCPFGAHSYQDLALQNINFTLLENQHGELGMEKQKQSECSIGICYVYIPQLIAFLWQIS